MSKDNGAFSCQYHHEMGKDPLPDLFKSQEAFQAYQQRAQELLEHWQQEGMELYNAYPYRHQLPDGEKYWTTIRSRKDKRYQWLVAVSPDIKVQEAINAICSAGDDGMDYESSTRFFTHYSYLRAWASAAGFASGDYIDPSIRNNKFRDLLTEIHRVNVPAKRHPGKKYNIHNIADCWMEKITEKEAKGCKTLKEKHDGNTRLKEIRGKLITAWSAEALLYHPLSAEAPRLISVANIWACPQAYYAFYYMLMALQAARGEAMPSDHIGGRAKFDRQWSFDKLSSDSPLLPWAITTTMSRTPKPRNWDEVKKTNNFKVDGITIYSGGDTDARFEQLFQEVVQQSNAGVKDGGLFHLTPYEDVHCLMRMVDSLKTAAKQNYENQKPPKEQLHYKMLDYLWALRKRRNYVDGTAFLFGPDHAGDAIQLREDLAALTSANNLLYEWMISEYPDPTDPDKTLAGRIHEWMSEASINLEMAQPDTPLAQRSALYGWS